MDIFNREKVKELEYELMNVETERNRYKNAYEELTAKVTEITKLNESIPEGCEKGPWCKACEFARAFRYTEYRRGDVYGLMTIYACGKGQSCKNFIQKEDAE